MKAFEWIAGGAFLLAVATGAVAQTDVPAMEDIVRIELVEGSRLPSGHHLAGLKVSLAPGWKTYWRTAGETGIPPRFDWSKSSNLADVRYYWPRPDILDVDGFRIIGFKNELVLPLELTPGPEGADIHAVLNLELGVCSKVCVPVNTRVSADLSEESAEGTFLIELAMSDQPQEALAHGLRSLSCALARTDDGYALRATIDLPKGKDDAEVVVFETDLKDVWVAPSTSKRNGDQLIAETSLISFTGETFRPDTRDLRITVISKSAALEISGCPPLEN